VEGVFPGIDFAHLHARSGEINSYPEFVAVMEIIEKKLGRRGLENMHIHLSGIEYGERGERRHLNLLDSDFHYRELLQVLKEMKVKGRVICESPNLEEDALLLQKIYREL
jgi:deoxyribonuclease-4